MQEMLNSMLELSDKLPISAIYGKWENTLAIYGCRGGGRAGYRRTLGFKVDRGGKGKSKRLKRGPWLRKRGVSLGL